jgi:hypothetical protein
MPSARRKPDEAPARVQRGLKINQETPHQYPARFRLEELERELLPKLGRGNETLDAAWAEYRRSRTSSAQKMLRAGGVGRPVG